MEAIGGVEFNFSMLTKMSRLFEACMNLNNSELIDKIENLIDDINTVDESGETALTRLVQRNCYQGVRHLIRHGADVNKGAHSPLHFANGLSIMEYLLEHDANMDQRDIDGATPVMTISNPEVVIRLLRKGADPLVIDHHGRNLLHTINDDRIVPYLVSIGVDINKGDNQKRTPLHHAVMKHNSTLVLTLLDEGANPNVQDESGATPFILACKLGDEKSATMLLGYDAAINIRDKFGKTGLCYAHFHCSKCFVQAIVSCGARE